MIHLYVHRLLSDNYQRVRRSLAVMRRQIFTCSCMSDISDISGFNLRGTQTFIIVTPILVFGPMGKLKLLMTMLMPLSAAFDALTRCTHTHTHIRLWLIAYGTNVATFGALLFDCVQCAITSN